MRKKKKTPNTNNNNGNTQNRINISMKIKHLIKQCSNEDNSTGIKKTNQHKKTKTKNRINKKRDNK